MSDTQRRPMPPVDVAKEKAHEVFEATLLSLDQICSVSNFSVSKGAAKLFGILCKMTRMREPINISK